MEQKTHIQISKKKSIHFFMPAIAADGNILNLFRRVAFSCEIWSNQRNNFILTISLFSYL